MTLALESIPERVGRWPFRRAVWLAPVAYCLHIAEEAPRFSLWASAHFGSFAPVRFVLNNAFAMGVLVLLTALASLRPTRATAFVFFAWLYFQILWNALFHAGTTAWFGVYSPGLITALVLYLPLSYRLTVLAQREHLLGNRTALVALSIGLALHAGLVAALAHGAFSG